MCTLFCLIRVRNGLPTPTGSFETLAEILQPPSCMFPTGGRWHVVCERRDSLVPLLSMLSTGGGVLPVGPENPTGVNSRRILAIMLEQYPMLQLMSSLTFSKHLSLRLKWEKYSQVNFQMTCMQTLGTHEKVVKLTQSQ